MKTVAGLPERIHAVGVGGGGLAPLARLLEARGHAVTGSDARPVPTLSAAGLAVHVGHDASYLGDAELVVRSAAVPDDNPEVAAALGRGVPVLRYSEALGAVMGARRGVAVAGTHGKTTTTALVAHLLRALDARPGWLVGGQPRSLPAAWGWEPGEHFVAEACEYGLSFLDLPFELGLLTGVTADHLDWFGDAAGVERAFARFVGRAPPGGVLVFGEQLPESVAAAAPAHARVVRAARRVGLGALREGPDGYAGELLVDGRALPFRLPLMGAHNLDLARLAVAAVLELGQPAEATVAALAGFSGVRRRLEDRGEQAGLGRGGSVRLIDDFAHHPEAVAAAAAACRTRFPGRRLVGVFQPHQVSRSEDFLDEFVAALGAFDAVLLCDIFVARDAHPERAPQALAALAAALGERAQTVGPARDAEVRVRAGLLAQDVCVVMGAGDVEQLAAGLAGAAARP